MKATGASARVQDQLAQAIDTGQVPDEEKRRAAQLLRRLKSSVEVVLIGRPGSGKSRLVNMLTGMTVIPETGRLPPLEVRYAPVPRTVYLMADGSEKCRDGHHLDQPTPAGTAIIRAEMPLDILTRLSLTEICLEGSPGEQKTIVDWAMNRADIVLWCSQDFDASEQALWAGAGEVLKDHSFLVLTKADQLQMKGVLSERIARLQDIVAEEFLAMFPLATIQAISASPSGGERDQGLWTSSGGKALMDAVLRLVATGRRADADNALIFLRRTGVELSIDGPEVATPEPPGRVAARDRVEPGGPQKAGVDMKVFGEALDFLQQRADQMLRVLRGEGPGNQAVVLDHCLETANRLSEIIQQVEATGPPLSDIQDDVIECGDMMVLFHLEKTEDAAEDAVTMLLQLKKEMAVAVSA